MIFLSLLFCFVFLLLVNTSEVVADVEIHIADDVVGLDTKSLLMSWLYLAYNPNTRMGGRMKDYKKTATLCEYTQDYELIRTWTIEGIFVTGITEGEFDRENDGKRKLSATFVFDRAVIDLPQ